MVETHLCCMEASFIIFSSRSVALLLLADAYVCTCRDSFVSNLFVSIYWPTVRSRPMP